MKMFSEALCLCFTFISLNRISLILKHNISNKISLYKFFLISDDIYNLIYQDNDIGKT